MTGATPLTKIFNKYFKNFKKYLRTNFKIISKNIKKYQKILKTNFKKHQKTSKDIKKYFKTNFKKKSKNNSNKFQNKSNLNLKMKFKNDFIYS